MVRLVQKGHAVTWFTVYSLQFIKTQQVVLWDKIQDYNNTYCCEPWKIMKYRVGLVEIFPEPQIETNV